MWVLVESLGADFGADFLVRIFQLGVRILGADFLVRIFQLGVRILGVEFLVRIFGKRRQPAEPCIFPKTPQNAHPKSSHHSGPQKKLLEGC